MNSFKRPGMNEIKRTYHGKMRSAHHIHRRHLAACSNNAAGCIASPGPPSLLSQFLERTSPRTCDKHAPNLPRPAETSEQQGLRRPCRARECSPASYRWCMIVPLKARGGQFVAELSFCRKLALQGERNALSLQVLMKEQGMDGGTS